VPRKKSPPTEPSPFALLLRSHRLANGLSQSALAMALNDNVKKIQDWEAGRTTPHPHSLQALATTFSLDAGEADAFRQVWMACRRGGSGPVPTLGTSWPMVTPFIVEGRRSQLERLMLLNTSARGAALVTGDYGVGKSWLVHHVFRASRTGVCIAHVTCQANEADAGYLEPMRRLFTALLDPARTTAGFRKRLIQAVLTDGERLVGTVLGATALTQAIDATNGLPARAVSRLNHLIDIPNSMPVTEASLLAAIAAVFGQCGTSIPMVVVVEDIHWADQSTLSALEFLATHTWTRDQRIRIVMTSRSLTTLASLGESNERIDRLRRLSALESVSRIDLNATLQETGEAPFVDAFLDLVPNTFDASIRAAIAKRTHGNPMFVREVVEWLRERAVIAQDEAGTWNQMEPMPDHGIPDGIEQLVDRQIQQLDFEARAVLRAAGLQGRHFILEVIADVLHLSGDRVADLLEDTIALRGFAVYAGPIHVGRATLHEYAFTHDHYWERVQSGVSKLDAETMHRAIAVSLEFRYGSHYEQIAALAGWHNELGAHPLEASRNYWHVGNQERLRGNTEHAIAWYDRALALIPADHQGAERSRTMIGKAAAHRFLGNMDLGLPLCRSGLEEALLFGGTHDIANAELQLGVLLYDLRRMDLALSTLRSAYARVEHDPSYPDLAQVLNFLSHAALVLGEYDQALSFAQKGQAHAYSTRNRHYLAEAIVAEANCLCDTGSFAQAHDRYVSALDMFRQAGEIRGQVLALINIALSQLERGLLHAAHATLDQVHDLSGAVHLGRLAIIERFYRGRVYELQESWDTALKTLQIAAARFREIDPLHPLAIDADAGALRVLLAQGDLLEAASILDSIEAWTTSRNLELTEYPILICTSGAQAAHALGRTRDASNWLDRGAAILDSRASRIVDPVMRRSYLSRVPINATLRTMLGRQGTADQFR
jgi:tetratricopeptide (TPR) repeat protein